MSFRLPTPIFLNLLLSILNGEQNVEITQPTLKDADKTRRIFYKQRMAAFKQGKLSDDAFLVQFKIVENPDGTAKIIGSVFKPEEHGIVFVQRNVVT